MNITIENKKQKAIELMNKLEIYKPYIKGFKDKNSVCFYENFGGFGHIKNRNLWLKSKNLKKNTTCLYMPSLTNTWNSANVTTSSTSQTMKKNGMKCFIRKAICFTPTLTFGTNPMTFALNSAQSASARSAVELKELHEVRYDENNH